MSGEPVRNTAATHAAGNVRWVGLTNCICTDCSGKVDLATQGDGYVILYLFVSQNTLDSVQ